MDKDVIFEVTEKHLETGMRGIPVGYCNTSTVDPQKGLYYVGTPLSEIADWDPERVIFLLKNGYDAAGVEMQEFKASLVQRSPCSPELLNRIKMLPREGHPMKLFCAALLLAGMLEGTNDYEEDCLQVIAKMPEIAATVINHHAGWGDTPLSQPDLGYMENFTQMLNVPGMDKEKFTHLFRVFNVLHYDHGGGNLSTFVGKAVASGLEDMYGSLASAMCALAGPRHGRANQDSLDMVKDILDELSNSITEENAEKVVRQRLENNQLLFGFGHAVLRVEDPRATILYGIANDYYADNPIVQVANCLRHAAPRVLKENPKISNPYPNVDAISGVLFTAAGLPYPEYYTVLFGLSRCIGIAIQIVYERLQARGGKGTPIVRPKYFYKAREGAVAVK